MKFVNSAAKVFQGFLCVYLILASYTVLAQQKCTTLKVANGTCVVAEECNDVKDTPILFGDDLIRLRQRSNELNLKCNPDASGNPTVCCNSVKFKKNKFFSGKNYEESLNPKGVRILQNKNIIDQCGIMKSDRMAYGVDTTLGEFPWMALLKYEDSEQPFRCGGSVITNQYVLTAAHCVMDPSSKLIAVRLGEYDISTEEDCTNNKNIKRRTCTKSVIDVNIAKVISHPQYSFVKHSYDIALIKLERSVAFHKYIRPICLPVTTITCHPVVLNNPYFIAGWGITEKERTSNILKKAVLTQRDREVCSEIYKRVEILDVHLCAGGEQLAASCKGDSGGPVFLPAPLLINDMQSFRYFQFGTISFGSPYCGINNNTYPAIFANVIEMMPWITSNID